MSTPEIELLVLLFASMSFNVVLYAAWKGADARASSVAETLTHAMTQLQIVSAWHRESVASNINAAEFIARSDQPRC